MQKEDDVFSGRPLGQLSPQSWLNEEQTQKIFSALSAEGAEVRFVGGCVRDALAHRPVRDIDIAVPYAPEETIRLLEKASIKAIPTGLSHGTITAVIDGKHFEITTLRRDIKTDGRHAEVEYTTDWKADASRRDFSINALSCTLDGAVYDYFDGIRDLGNGVIRFVGLPKRRIEEDFLRILRFFRFFAHYGSPPLDSEALAACRVNAAELENLSAERIGTEIMRILEAPDPATVLLVMQGERILPHILPEASDFGRLRVLCWLEKRGVVMRCVWPDALRRLASLVDLDEKGAVDLARRLRLSKKHAKRLARLCMPPLDVTSTMERAELHHWLYTLGSDDMRDYILLAWSRRKSLQSWTPGGETDRWIALLEQVDCWEKPRFPLTGKDALALGLDTGKQIGILLRSVEEWWKNNGFNADKERCLEKLQELVASEHAFTAV